MAGARRHSRRPTSSSSRISSCALFESQGIRFRDVFICPHLPADGCACRKPRPGLLTEFLSATPLDRSASVVIGDRATDMELAANIGLRGLKLDPADPDDWARIAHELVDVPRTATVSRVTRETRIECRVDLDADSPIRIDTGIAFFDHMLEQLAKHGGFSLVLNCRGDLQVDEHHTVEDVALALGEALRRALGDKRGIGRYGFVLPMDEAQARVAIDLSGRAFCVFEGVFPRAEVGRLPTELVPHFFRSLADSLGAAVHISVTGENTHHMVEACFKGTGRALRQALARQGTALPSTKGIAVMPPTVAIIDGAGANIASLRFALERLGSESVLTTDADVIRRASHVILPGVGAASTAMENLRGAALDRLIPALTPAGARHLPRHAAAVRCFGGGRRPLPRHHRRDRAAVRAGTGPTRAPHGLEPDPQNRRSSPAGRSAGRCRLLLRPQLRAAGRRFDRR